MIRYRNSFLATVFAFSLIAAQNNSQAEELPQEQEAVHNFGVRIDGGAKASYWHTDDDDDSSDTNGNVLDYHPEIIPTKMVQGQLTWQDNVIYHVSYESPYLLGKTEEQNAALEIARKKSTIRKLHTYLNLLMLAPQDAEGVMGFISRLRLDYRYHVFVGKATVQKWTEYIDTYGNVTQLNPDDQISFKSEFSEISIYNQVSHKLWFGIYQNTTLKPYEASTMMPHVLKTKITGTGLKFLVETESFTFDTNLGIVKFRADRDNFRSNGYEVVLHGDWHPNFYIFGSENDRHSLSIVPSLGAQWYMQFGDKAPGWESNGMGEMSMDIIVDAGLRLHYKF